MFALSGSHWLTAIGMEAETAGIARLPVDDARVPGVYAVEALEGKDDTEPLPSSIDCSITGPLLR